MNLAPLLSNLTICCTGIDEELRLSVQRRTEALGGRYSAHLTKDCTHLIAGNVLKSQKYKSAIRFGIPVVHQNWIEECWNLAHISNGPIEEQRKVIIQLALNKFSITGLVGCVVSVTGVAFDERAKICSMVEELGGSYSPALTPQCTHLIYQPIDNEEDERISLYSTSQSYTSKLPVKVQFATKWEIPVVSKQWIFTCYSKRCLVDEADFPIIICNENDDLLSQDVTISTEILPVQLNEIQEDTSPFLSGCHIYLNSESISVQRHAVLKRLILAAGGVRYTDIQSSPILTHIIIHNQVLPNNFSTILETTTAKLVHDTWLFDSFKERRRLSEAEYEINKKSTQSANTEEPVKNERISQSQPSKWKNSLSNSNNNKNNGPNNSFLNASFLNANNSSFLLNAATPKQQQVEEEDFLRGTPNVFDSTLKGKSIYFAHTHMAKKADDFTSRIKKLSAKARRLEMHIVEKDIEADWCITSVVISQVQYKELTTRHSPSSIKNDIWFEAVLESKSSTSTSSSQFPSTFYSQPLVSHYNLPLQQFSKYTISQSGYTGIEREFCAEVIRMIGANYTDNLSRNNTHLLIEQPRTGTKFEHAKKWKIECIDMNWIKNQLCTFEKGELDVEVGKVKGRNVSSFSDVVSTKENYNSLQINSQLSQAKLSFQTGNSGEGSYSQNKEKIRENEELMIFKGLVFASSQRLWHRRDELCSIVESLGGVYLWSFDRNCTHYIHQGNLVDENFKEFKQAKQWGKLVVSPMWIVQCKENGKRLEESHYPHTLKMTLNEEQLTNAVAVTTDITTTNTTIQDVPPDNQNKHKLESHSQPLHRPISQSQSQQRPQIDWEAIMAERKSREYQIRPGSKIFNIDSHPAFANRPHHLSEIPNVEGSAGDCAPKPVQLFNLAFSGYKSNEKNELIQTVSENELLKSQFLILAEDKKIDWNPKKTFLICDTLSHTEKFFSACVTGCWILRGGFIAHLPKLGRNFDLLTDYAILEKFELSPAWNSNETESIFFKAPKYWRIKLRSNPPPFSHWKCSLAVETKFFNLFNSILSNGGAQIVPLSTASQDSASISHLFYSDPKLIPQHLRALLREDQIFSTKFITNTIFNIQK